MKNNQPQLAKSTKKGGPGGHTERLNDPPTSASNATGTNDNAYYAVSKAFKVPGDESLENGLLIMFSGGGNIGYPCKRFKWAK
jgi:hypothetical protein